MKKLIGKKIKEIFLDKEEQHYLLFVTDRGKKFLYYADGGCCSESWFADVIGINTLIGETILSVKKMDMNFYNVDDGRGRQDSDIAYGYKITTNKGYCDIIFRNSSNGYYGSSLELISESPESFAEENEDKAYLNFNLSGSVDNIDDKYIKGKNVRVEDIEKYALNYGSWPKGSIEKIINEKKWIKITQDYPF